MVSFQCHEQQSSPNIAQFELLQSIGYLEFFLLTEKRSLLQFSATTITYTGATDQSHQASHNKRLINTMSATNGHKNEDSAPMYPAVADTLIVEDTNIADEEAKARAEAQAAEESGDGKATFKAAMAALKAAEKRKAEEDRLKNSKEKERAAVYKKVQAVNEAKRKSKVTSDEDDPPIVAAPVPAPKPKTEPVPVPEPVPPSPKKEIIAETPVVEKSSFQELMAKAKKKESSELAHQAASLDAYKKRKEEERILKEKKAEEDKIAAEKKAKEDAEKALLADAKELENAAYEMNRSDALKPPEEPKKEEADPLPSSGCCIIS